MTNGFKIPTSRSRLALIILAILFVLGVLTTGLNPKQGEKNPEVKSATDSVLVEAKVISVSDGDTFDVEINGSKEKVRMIGIDTPETVHPEKPVQCFGLEASNKLKSLLSNKAIKLEKDDSQGDQDRYGRKLRYVFLDNENINRLMLEEGYAYEYTFDEAYKYQAEFKQAEKIAKENQIGLWNPNTCNGKPTSTISSTPKPITTSIIRQQCKYSCVSPDRDCKDFSSRKEAEEFFSCCGFSQTNDPMKLDGIREIGDGKVCESLPD